MSSTRFKTSKSKLRLKKRLIDLLRKNTSRFWPKRIKKQRTSVWLVSLKKLSKKLRRNVGSPTKCKMMQRPWEKRSKR
jgi:hypothetical protein